MGLSVENNCRGLKAVKVSQVEGSKLVQAKKVDLSISNRLVDRLRKVYVSYKLRERYLSKLRWYHDIFVLMLLHRDFFIYALCIHY